MDGDGSYNPKALLEMRNLIETNDAVFCSRYKDGAKSPDDTPIRAIGNKIFTLLGNIFFKLDISDILYTYILGKSESFKNLNLSYKDFRICVEIPIKAKKKKFNYNSIPSYERKRIGGKKKVNAIKDGLLILFAMVRLFFK